MHLVDAAARMRLFTMGLPAASVPFIYNGHIKMTLLHGEAALIARRDIALRLKSEPQTMAALRCQLCIEKPNFALMQQLYDAGIGQCPTSGMPIYNPSKCSPALLKALWRYHCGVAMTVNTKALEQTAEALDELQKQLCEHAGGQGKRQRVVNSDGNTTDTGEASEHLRKRRMCEIEGDEAEGMSCAARNDRPLDGNHCHIDSDDDASIASGLRKRKRLWPRRIPVGDEDEDEGVRPRAGLDANELDTRAAPEAMMSAAGDDSPLINAVDALTAATVDTSSWTPGADGRLLLQAVCSKHL